MTFGRTVTVWHEGPRQWRDDLLDRLLTILHGDSRVQAAWLSGSLGRGTEDDWSDLDLHVAVVDDHFHTWLAERSDLYHRLGTPVLVLPDKPSNAGDGPYQGVLFAGPVFLDFNVHPVSASNLGIDCRILFDRLPLPPYQSSPLAEDERATRIEESVGRFWKMTPITLKHVARGQTDLAVIQLNVMLGAFVNSWRLVHAPKRLSAGGAHWLHPERDARLCDAIPVLGERIDACAVLDAVATLMREMEALHQFCTALGVVVPEEAAMEIGRFHDAVAAKHDRAANIH